VPWGDEATSGWGSNSSQDLGLPTEPSKFQKFLEILSRPNYAKNAALKDILSGKGHIGSDILSALKGENPVQGSDVLSTVLGAQNRNTSTMEKMGRGAGGFALDALTDPLNLVAVGPISKAAKGLSKLGDLTSAGSGMDLAKAGQLSPGIFNQMRKGQRAAASIGFGNHTLETPDWINSLVGEVGGRAGQALNALPGADLVKEAFTPTFNKLRNVTGAIRQGTEDFMNTHLSSAPTETNALAKLGETAGPTTDTSLDAMKGLFREGAI
jgi:hypothetical protein